MARRWLFPSLTAVILASQATAAFATIKVDGHVKHADGSAAADATVHLVYWDVNSSTKIEKTTTTDATGYYVFPQAVGDVGGSYFIASKPGFQSYTYNKELGEFDNATVDLTLGAAVPIIEAPHVTTPPALDGVVNAPEWAGAAVVTPFYKNLATTPYDPNTTGYVVWDDANLYIGIVADEPNTADILAVNTTPDELAIFNDDRSGFYLDPTGYASFAMGHEIWQVQSNLTPTGLIDGLLRTAPTSMSLTPSYDIPGLAVAVHRDDANHQWSMEFKVPLAGVGCPETGMTVETPTIGTEWRLLLTRKRAKLGHSMGSAVTLGGYSNATQWQTLRFVGPAVVPPMRGDVDGNKVVDLADAAAALKIAAGLENGASAVPAGDVVASDSAITFDDALAIARYAGGASTTL